MSAINEYVKVGVEGKFNISPSMVATFLDNPQKWYKSQVTKEDDFKGNTNTVLGTIVHSAIEQYYIGDELTSSDVDNYLDSLDIEVDRDYITKSWKEMADLGIAETVRPDRQEYQTMVEIDDEVTVGGSVDRRKGEAIQDIKTCSSIKPSIGDYKWQLMVYAWCDKQQGIDTRFLDILYIQRPNEGYPSLKTGKTIGVKKADARWVTYEITEQDWIDVENLMLLIADTYKLVKANPSIADLVFRHNPLSFRQ